MISWLYTIFEIGHPTTGKYALLCYLFICKFWHRTSYNWKVRITVNTCLSASFEIGHPTTGSMHCCVTCLSTNFEIGHLTTGKYALLCYLFIYKFWHRTSYNLKVRIQLCYLFICKFWDRTSYNWKVHIAYNVICSSKGLVFVRTPFAACFYLNFLRCVSHVYCMPFKDNTCIIGVLAWKKFASGYCHGASV